MSLRLINQRASKYPCSPSPKSRIKIFELAHRHKPRFSILSFLHSFVYIFLSSDQSVHHPASHRSEAAGAGDQSSCVYPSAMEAAAAAAHADDTSTFPPAFFSGSDHRDAAAALPARVAGAVVRGVITFVFATVGTILGAITGGLIGLATESGLVRGAGIGAISGAVVAMEVVDRCLAIWRSDQSAIWSVLYVLDVIWSLLNGRLVREKVDPAVQSAVDSQMTAAGFGDDSGPPTLSEMFDAASFKGMATDAIADLPVTNITDADAGCCCSVCLQDMEAGETARRLPECGHTFHLACIDGWLRRHASCPLCRRAV